MDYILLGIDGTGAISNTTYRQEMHNSFVSYITRNFRGPHKHSLYLRGPGFDGIDLAATANQGRIWVMGTAQTHRQHTILLTGYSRGASAVIDVARALQRENLNVGGMVLFDAVDRTPTSSGAVIPPNVRRAAHAQRDRASYSRWTFGNCGTGHSGSTQYESRSFFCTHGGMGGAPWPLPVGSQLSDPIEEGFPEPTPTTVSYARDRQGSREVWAWASPKLREMGFVD